LTRAKSTTTDPLPVLAAGSQRPTRVRYVVMAFLCGLSFLTYFDRFSVVRTQGEIQRDLHIGDGQMSLIFGAFWLAYGLFEIPGGWLGDRFGGRGTLGRIVLAWSLFTALSGSAVGFTSLLACRFLFGVGEAGAYPNMARVQARWLAPRERARMGGLLWLFARWGGAFAPPLIGLFLAGVESHRFRGAIAGVPGLRLIGQVATWRLAFWMSGLLGVVWVVAFLVWFRDDPAEKRSVNAAELALIRAGRTPGGEAGDGHRMPARAWAALFTSPSLWAIAGLYFCSSFGWSFFASWMPRFYQDVHGISFKRSEWMSGLPLFFGGLSCLLGGWLSDAMVRRTGRKRLWRAVFPVTGYSTAAAAMAAIPFVKSPVSATVLLCLANAAVDFGQGANWASIVDIGGSYAGTATGFINMIGNMANFAGPVVGQWIFHGIGWGALFAAYATAFLIAASMWAFIHPDRRFYER
jgi:MFS transporter, ACS family, glucarate transporter